MYSRTVISHGHGQHFAMRNRQSLRAACSDLGSKAMSHRVFQQRLQQMRDLCVQNRRICADAYSPPDKRNRALQPWECG
jgi:hypothetical protein